MMMWIPVRPCGQLSLARIVAVALALSASGYASAISISAGVAIGPTVERWGWDTKGGSSRFNTLAKAAEAYSETVANLLRVPIEPTFHNPDGSINLQQYQSDINAIKNVLAVNPNVEVFASLKLLGADTFPDWLGASTPDWPASTGSIFGNDVPRPNPEIYSVLVANYIDMLRSEGIAVDYVGLNNESDGALGTTRYIATARLLRDELEARNVPSEFRDFQYIGPDSFGLNTAESYMASIANQNGLDTIDIIGSHFYPQHSSGNADSWGNLASDYNKPLWHTEVHMPVGNADYDGKREQALRDTLSVLFATNAQGADSFVWWGYDGNEDAVGQAIKRDVINSTLGATPIATTPGYTAKADPEDEPLFQAYLDGGEVSLWISNPGPEILNETVGIDSGFLRLMNSGDPLSSTTAEFRDVATGSSAGYLTSTLTPSSDGTSFAIDSIPANSIGLITFNIATPGDINIDGALDQADVEAFASGWLFSQPEGNFASWLHGDLNQDGLTNITDFVLLRSAVAAQGGLGLESSLQTLLQVPEPGALTLALLGLIAVGVRRRFAG